jgi:hypothetical protein
MRAKRFALGALLAAFMVLATSLVLRAASSGPARPTAANPAVKICLMCWHS